MNLTKTEAVGLTHLLYQNTTSIRLTIFRMRKVLPTMVCLIVNLPDASLPNDCLPNHC